MYDYNKMTIVVFMLEVISMQTMAVGEFKAKCLAVMTKISLTGESLLVTKHGKPLVKVVPSEEPLAKEAPEAIFGCLRHMATLTGDMVSSTHSEEEWERIFSAKWDRVEPETAN